MFKGYKTYVASGLMFLFGLYGLVTGNLEQGQAVQVILEALAIAGLRNAI